MFLNMYLNPGQSGSACGWLALGPAPRSPSPEMIASVKVGVRWNVWTYGDPPTSAGPPVQVPEYPVFLNPSLMCQPHTRRFCAWARSHTLMSGLWVVGFRKRRRPEKLCRMSISHPNSAGLVFAITY